MSRCSEQESVVQTTTQADTPTRPPKFHAMACVSDARKAVEQAREVVQGLNQTTGPGVDTGSWHALMAQSASGLADELLEKAEAALNELGDGLHRERHTEAPQIQVDGEAAESPDLALKSLPPEEQARRRWALVKTTAALHLRLIEIRQRAQAVASLLEQTVLGDPVDPVKTLQPAEALAAELPGLIQEVADRLDEAASGCGTPPAESAAA